MRRGLLAAGLNKPPEACAEIIGSEIFGNVLCAPDSPKVVGQGETVTCQQHHLHGSMEAIEKVVHPIEDDEKRYNKIIVTSLNKEKHDE
jgi:hypothetical protein